MNDLFDDDIFIISLVLVFLLKLPLKTLRLGHASRERLGIDNNRIVLYNYINKKKRVKSRVVQYLEKHFASINNDTRTKRIEYIGNNYFSRVIAKKK